MRPLLLFALLASCAVPAQPQSCDGDPTVVRINTIKPGKLDTFLAAVAAHKAWYRANGVTDNDIVPVRILVRDDATKGWKTSDQGVMTFHYRPPSASRTPNRGDEAWNAYVKLYQESSELKSEYMTCMPKHGH